MIADCQLAIHWAIEDCGIGAIGLSHSAIGALGHWGVAPLLAWRESHDRMRNRHSPNPQ